MFAFKDTSPHTRRSKTEPHKEVFSALSAAVVYWNHLRPGGLGIPERIGSNTDYGLSGYWGCTRGKGSQVGGLSDRRSPLGGLI